MSGKVVTEERLYCPKSPNNRHRWMVAPLPKDGAYPAVCKHCLEVHMFAAYPQTYFYKGIGID
ncbi:hypothetical protein LCGC14_1216940 [marine sediment metagenome]|uniref:Uncharacterized protein n=1 Tax=marine sediment metagenome TaxID=412755 RepID=A0A0F9LCG2_9ZZZZ